jgi:hypothetical protein
MTFTLTHLVAAWCVGLACGAILITWLAVKTGRR